MYVVVEMVYITWSSTLFYTNMSSKKRQHKLTNIGDCLKQCIQCETGDSSWASCLKNSLFINNILVPFDYCAFRDVHYISYNATFKLVTHLRSISTRAYASADCTSRLINQINSLILILKVLSSKYYPQSTILWCAYACVACVYQTLHFSEKDTEFALL
jgi:hypothetical protein